MDETKPKLVLSLVVYHQAVGPRTVRGKFGLALRGLDGGLVKLTPPLYATQQEASDAASLCNTTVELTTIDEFERP